MNTTTAEKTEAPPVAQVAQSQGEVAVFKPPRLPYHEVIHERFPEVDRGAWKALVEAVYPNAKSVDAIILALTYCKSRKLDPFKRPVHIVPMWDSKSDGYIETVWPGISELRTTAFRTQDYAGCDETEFGPLIEKEFKGRVKEKGAWIEKTVKVTFHEWARITIHRLVKGTICKFVGPKVLWIESYASIGASDVPNNMWQERSVGQLEKCAEAAALRRAFPEELGSEYAAEEMEGREKFVDVVQAAEIAKNIVPAVERQATISEAKVTSTPAQSQGSDIPPDLDAEDEKPRPTSSAQPAATQKPPKTAAKSAEPDQAGNEAPPALDGEIIPPTKPRTKDDVFLEFVDTTLAEVTEAEDLEEAWNAIYSRIKNELSGDRQGDAFALYRRHELRLGFE